MVLPAAMGTPLYAAQRDFVMRTRKKIGKYLAF